MRIVIAARARAVEVRVRFLENQMMIRKSGKESARVGGDLTVQGSGRTDAVLMVIGMAGVAIGRAWRGLGNPCKGSQPLSAADMARPG